MYKEDLDSGGHLMLIYIAICWRFADVRAALALLNGDPLSLIPAEHSTPSTVNQHRILYPFSSVSEV